MESKFSEVIEKGIGLLQIIFIPTFFIMFLLGLIFFIIAMRNPIRKRTGYLLTITGFIGSLFITYGPLIIYYISQNNEDWTSSGISSSVEGIGWKVYDILATILTPLIGVMFYVGVGFWLLAAKSPTRKRIGIGLMLFSPLTYVIMQYLPELYNFLKTS